MVTGFKLALTLTILMLVIIGRLIWNANYRGMKFGWKVSDKWIDIIIAVIVAVTIFILTLII